MFVFFSADSSFNLFTSCMLRDGSINAFLFAPQASPQDNISLMAFVIGF